MEWIDRNVPPQESILMAVRFTTINDGQKVWMARVAYKGQRKSRVCRTKQEAKEAEAALAARILRPSTVISGPCGRHSRPCHPCNRPWQSLWKSALSPSGASHLDGVWSA